MFYREALLLFGSPRLAPYFGILRFISVKFSLSLSLLHPLPPRCFRFQILGIIALISGGAGRYNMGTWEIRYMFPCHYLPYPQRLRYGALCVRHTYLGFLPSDLGAAFLLPTQCLYLMNDRCNLGHVANTTPSLRR